jgi:hypothetical protein
VLPDAVVLSRLVLRFPDGIPDAPTVHLDLVLPGPRIVLVDPAGAWVVGAPRVELALAW